MMDTDDLNPYASPAVPAEAYDEEWEKVRQGAISAWRDGRYLVVRNTPESPAQLPPYCLRTNEPTPHRVSLSATYGFFDSFFHLTPKNVTLEAPVNAAWKSRWVWIQRIAIGVAVCGGLCFIAAFLLLDRRARIGILIAPLTFILAALIAKLNRHGLTLVVSKKEFYWLAGVNAEYLDMLPEWPLRGLQN